MVWERCGRARQMPMRLLLLGAAFAVTQKEALSSVMAALPVFCTSNATACCRKG